MKKILVKKSTNFTTINNEFIFNKEMSLKAKGLLCHLLALPETWDLYVEEVEQWHKDGKSAIYSAFKELSSLGYVERTTQREKGKIVKWDYVVYEKPHIENLKVENLDVENQPLLNTDSIKYLNKLNTKKVINIPKEVFEPNNDFEWFNVKDLNVSAWREWRIYRKETFRSKYKPIGEKAAIKKLMRLSQGCQELQRKILQQSIENGWKGIFELKEEKQSKTKSALDNWQKARNMINNG
tara:strand:+ start:616 stop:1332 length:717 start_codon:yes stop_codon:yes gene_type:complete